MTRALSVAHVVHSFRLGGAERMAIELATRTRSADVRTALISTHGDGPLSAEIPSSVAWHALERTSRWQFSAFTEFRRFLREQAVDVVHSHGPGPLQFVTAALLPRGVRHIYHDHHSRESVWRPSPPLATQAAFARGLSAVLAVSQLGCEWAVQRMRFPSKRTFLLRNGIDTERFNRAVPAPLRTQYLIPADRFLIAVIANFRWQKDHLTALRALAACPARERLHLLLVGSPNDAERELHSSLQEECIRLGLEGSVTFAGPRQDVPDVLAACDAGLLSSCRESGPLAVLEFMAAGLPFVSTRVGEIGQGLPEGEGGYFAPPQDPPALARALTRLAEHTEADRKALGQRGRELVCAQYDQQQTAERLAEIYRQVLKW